jgi:hypothetical protein
MRFLYDKRPEGKAIGARAAADVRAILDPARTSEQIARRLQELSGAGRLS